MYKLQPIVRTVEVEQLTQTWQFDGVDITVRCFYVIAPKPRYELLMSGRGSAGVIDVPVDREDSLPAQMEEAAVCFATVVRLRQAMAS